MDSLHELLQKQRQYFYTNATRSIAFRTKQLKLLAEIIRKYQNDIMDALSKDLHKSAFESYETEIGIVLSEICQLFGMLPKWAKPKSARTPLQLLPGKSYIYHEPYGVCLIISPWNYPFQLTISPLLGAIAAGNCVTLKLSEYSVHTTQILQKMLQEAFPPEYVSVVTGDSTVGQALLQETWDMIFFTGNPTVGKTVMQAAAQHLTPVVLELGGKSPCLIDQNVNLATAVKRIAWGKFLNVGQTCVAPDYLLVHESIKDQFIVQLRQQIIAFYGSTPQQSPDYGRIISARHFSRLQKLLDPSKIVIGGQSDEKDLYIAPTVMDHVTWTDPIMQEEIFGPILPIITISNWDQTIAHLHALPKPLALYLFSDDSALQQKVLQQVSFGGGCLNDTILHLANPNLPFGGVGMSGMGAYHGQSSLEVFSHAKSIFHQSRMVDIPMRYPPYRDKLRWLKKFIR